MTKQAVIYTRFSPRPNAEECDSCEKQNQRCCDYCKAKGYDIFASGDDPGVSGKTRDRKGLNHCIGLLKAGMVLVVDRSDRLARDMLVSLMIHAEVEKIGATIEFADGSPIRSTPEGKLFQNILAAFANFEREKFSERTRIGMEKKKKAGVWCGRPPYGFRKLEGHDKLVEFPSEQDIISELVKRDKMGHSIAQLKNYLDVIGSYCRGKPWNVKTIRRILGRNA